MFLRFLSIIEFIWVFEELDDVDSVRPVRRKKVDLFLQLYVQRLDISAIPIPDTIEFEISAISSEHLGNGLLILVDRGLEIVAGTLLDFPKLDEAG